VFIVSDLEKKTNKENGDQDNRLNLINFNSLRSSTIPIILFCWRNLFALFFVCWALFFVFVFWRISSNYSRKRVCKKCSSFDLIISFDFKLFLRIIVVVVVVVVVVLF